MLAKIPAKILSCQDPVRIPAGKFRFPARFFISRQDPGRKRDSWRDPVGIPVAILQVSLGFVGFSDMVCYKCTLLGEYLGGRGRV